MSTRFETRLLEAALVAQPHWRAQQHAKAVSAYLLHIERFVAHWILRTGITPGNLLEVQITLLTDDVVVVRPPSHPLNATEFWRADDLQTETLVGRAHTFEELMRHLLVVAYPINSTLKLPRPLSWPDLKALLLCPPNPEP